MQLIDTVEKMSAWEGAAPVVLVPTMGALHAGHLALIEEARALAGDEGSVVTSIFVNPAQFGREEDLTAYPRELETDLAKCRDAGTDIVFHPQPDDMSAGDQSVRVSESSIAKLLEGTSRPGHFDGVCTVVLKLFNIVVPKIAVFGKKDYQQLAVIRRMVRDLHLDIDIRGIETVREEDGLAMSSRNVHLGDEERAQAPVIRAALLEAMNAVKAGDTKSAALRQKVVSTIRQNAPLARIDYVEIADAQTMQPVATAAIGETVLAAAVFFGDTRLIDNIEIN